jgi:hypothetical protein
MKVIFVHGRSQGGKNAEELQLFWKGCLDRTFRSAGMTWPETVKVEFPFYADDLDRMMAHVDAPLIDGILLRGERNVGSRESLRVEMISEILEERGIRDDAVLSHFQGQPLEQGPQNWRWVLAMLRALDSTPIGGDAIDAITRDVWVYISFGGVRAKIDAIIGAAIPNDPCIVVAHSLGTIIAYNVLSKRTPRFSAVPLFVTLGSPLGMRTISSRLRPIATPPAVAKWFNARDRRDVIALFPLDSEHFDVQRPIEDYSLVDNFTSNRHSIDLTATSPIPRLVAASSQR